MEIRHASKKFEKRRRIFQTQNLSSQPNIFQLGSIFSFCSTVCVQVIDFTLLQEFDSSSHNHPTVQMTHKRFQLFRVSESLYADTYSIHDCFEIWVCAIYCACVFCECVHIWLCTKTHKTYNCKYNLNEKNSGSSPSRESSF